MLKIVSIFVLFLCISSESIAALVSVISVERSYVGNANAVPTVGPVVSSGLSEMQFGLGSLSQVLATANSGDGTTMTARGESASASMVSDANSAQIVLEAISGAGKSSQLFLVPQGNNAQANATVSFRGMLDFSSSATATPLVFTSNRFVFGNNTSGTLSIREQSGPTLFTSELAALPPGWTITAQANRILLLDVDLLSNSFNDFNRPGSVDFDNQSLTLGITAVPEPSLLAFGMLGSIIVVCRRKFQSQVAAKVETILHG